MYNGRSFHRLKIGTKYTIITNKICIISINTRMAYNIVCNFLNSRHENKHILKVNLHTRIHATRVYLQLCAYYALIEYVNLQVTK